CARMDNYRDVMDYW
nr:immunoglobulin heavy chain junction region [Mus musculus]MBK4196191.1 immunoglobulin heavy chain junction region [Mus musculus]